jgi:arylsulfatase A-like enzyme
MLRLRSAKGDCVTEAQKTPRKRKNVLLIVVDQWRGDVLSTLGTPHLKTPNLDRLCREGVTFRNHFTQSVPCGPARASMLTGLYQMTHRAVQNTIPLDARFTNLGHELRALGYDPALIGYTTTTPDPRTTSAKDPRFLVLGDTMEGFRPVSTFEPGREAYFAWIANQGHRLPSRREEVWLPREGDPGATNAASRTNAELSDTAWFTAQGLAYLKGAGNRPWFLHLGYWRPHPPFIAPAPYNGLYDPADMPAPIRARTPEVEAAQHPLLKFYLDTVPQSMFFQDAKGLTRDMSEAEVRRTRSAYYALMTEIDDHLGRVFEYLEQTGQWDDTLIVFTCDHGEQLGDHYLLGKLGYFDGSFRIPMIVRDPSADADATRGQIVDRFTETIDTMPTILHWLGGEIPRQCDGRSLLPFLYGKPPADWRTEVHYEYDFRDVFYSQPEKPLGLHMDQCSLAVVQDEAWKYVHFAALPPLLFNLAEDPGQFRNLANDPAHATVVRDYAQRMLSWRMTAAEKTLTGYRASPRGLERRA